MVFPRIRPSALALGYIYIIDLKQARVNEILLFSEIRENDPHKIRSDYPFLSVIDRFPKGSSLVVIKKLFIYNNVSNIADILNQLKASAINS